MNPSPPAQSQLLVLLDFDRTTFDTERFFRDLLEMVEQTYGPQIATAMRDTERYAKPYDVFSRLDQAGITQERVLTEFQAFQKHHKAQNSYLFDDALPLIEALKQRPRTHVAILTTGTQRAQQFKRALCPELGDLPFEIVPTNKGAILQTRFDDRGGLTHEGQYFEKFALIDDGLHALEAIKPHSAHLLIHLLRPGAKYPEHSTRSDIVEVSSLAQVLQLSQTQELLQQLDKT